MLKWVCALAGVQGDVRFTAEELPCLCTRMQREGAHTHRGRQGRGLCVDRSRVSQCVAVGTPRLHGAVPRQPLTPGMKAVSVCLLVGFYRVSFVCGPQSFSRTPRPQGL